MHTAEHFPNSGETTQNKNHWLKKLAGKVAIAAALFGGAGLAASLTTPGTAHAEARPKGVSLEQYGGNGKVRAHGSVVKDCNDTLGCWTYMKIIKFDPPLYANPLKVNNPEFGWKFVGGRWIENGTSTLEVNCAGRGMYRAVVEAYNAMPGDTGSFDIHVEGGGVSGGYSYPAGSGVRNYRVADYSTVITAC